MSHTLRKLISFLMLTVFLNQISGCSGVPNYAVSDHYDGTRFFNPENPKGNDIWADMKLIVSFDFAEWPEFVKNEYTPELQRKLDTDQIAITFINHSTTLIQSKDFAVLTDPVWSNRVTPFGWIGPQRHREPGTPIAGLPKIDLVVISHNHYDHMDVETLKRLEREFHPTFMVPLGNKKILVDAGLERVVESDWWQYVEVAPGLAVTLAPAMHISGRGIFDKNKALWGSYFISLNGHNVYFAGDTGYASHFKAIHERLGAPDIALLPIGAYEPRWFMKEVHMNPEEALQAHLDLGSKQSIGIHFGTFQLTNEGINQPIYDLNRAMDRSKFSEDLFLTLGNGQTKVFSLTQSGETAKN